MPMGQTILPSSTIFAGADVYLKTINPGTGSDKLTLNLREGSIQGTVVASATVEVADGFSSLVHIPLAKPAWTVPGTLYMLELQATRPTHAWVLSDQPYNTYEDGTAIFTGSEKSDRDMWFSTYCGPAN